MEENQVPAFDATDITDDDKLWSLLSWITGIVAVIVLFMEDKKSRPFLKYNAVMALVVVVVQLLLAQPCDEVDVNVFTVDILVEIEDMHFNCEFMIFKRRAVADVCHTFELFAPAFPCNRIDSDFGA